MTHEHAPIRTKELYRAGAARTGTQQILLGKIPVYRARSIRFKGLEDLLHTDRHAGEIDRTSHSHGFCARRSIIDKKYASSDVETVRVDTRVSKGGAQEGEY